LPRIAAWEAICEAAAGKRPWATPTVTEITDPVEVAAILREQGGEQ
jgi:hypothetical protein